jgi:Uma2 family endonuclease
MNAAAVLKYTAEEYLDLEEASLEKNKFYKGEIFAMAGASIPHNQIVSNTNTEIGYFLKDKKCRVFPSDLRIHSIANSLYTYPDLSIICEEIETVGKKKNTVTNPTVLIQVLSETTQDYDRGAKFKLYRDIESLKEYILISSLETLVEKYNKQADGSWVLHEYKSETDTFTITSIDLLITVKDLYRNVDFTNAETAE